MPYRHPSVLANIAAAVDVISSGRLNRARRRLEPGGIRRLGIELPPFRERFDRFDEGLRGDHRAADRGPQFSFSGRHFTLTDAYCEPKGVQGTPPADHDRR